MNWLDPMPGESCKVMGGLGPCGKPAVAAAMLERPTRRMPVCQGHADEMRREDAANRGQP